MTSPRLRASPCARRIAELASGVALGSFAECTRSLAARGDLATASLAAVGLAASLAAFAASPALAGVLAVPVLCVLELLRRREVGLALLVVCAGSASLCVSAAADVVLAGPGASAVLAVLATALTAVASAAVLLWHDALLAACSRAAGGVELFRGVALNFAL
eukprot:m51a1_g4801 hypothetical protein (162) ;mRNA; r:111318-111803